MPHKEPLTRAKTKGWRKAPTGDIELTGRARTKLRAQISRAERIMRVERQADRPTSKTFYSAKQVRDRARRILGEKTPSPGKARTDDKSKKRQGPVGKAINGEAKKILEAIGKIGWKKDGR